MESLRHGAAGYLLKPFNVTELISLISQTIEKKQRLDLIRPFFTTVLTLWGSEYDCARAWDSSKPYFAIGNKEHETAYGGPSPRTCSALVRLIEAKDRQLLNHSSRVSFYATCLPIV